MRAMLALGMKAMCVYAGSHRLDLGRTSRYPFRADVKDVGCISNLGPGREVTEPDESPRRVRVWCSLLMLPGVDPKIHFGFERASPFSARPLPPRAARSLFFFFSLSLSVASIEGLRVFKRLFFH